MSNQANHVSLVKDVKYLTSLFLCSFVPLIKFLIWVSLIELLEKFVCYFLMPVLLCYYL